MASHSGNSGLREIDLGDVNWFADGDYDDEDFGIADLEDYYNQEYGKKIYCESPDDHRFEKKILATHYYRECVFCGYSPEHDGNKEDYYLCHKEYLQWEKARKK